MPKKLKNSILSEDKMLIGMIFKVQKSKFAAAHAGMGQI
jgi:hypothetical protein